MSVDNKIHVLHVASGDLWAGAEMQLCTLARTQQGLPGLRVSVALLNHGRLERELQAAGVPVTVLDESRLGGFAILSRLIRTVRKLSPDIMHTHGTKENVLGGIAARLCGNRPSVRTVHGAPEHRPPMLQLHKHAYRLLDWFSGRFLQQKVIAVSADLAEVLSREFPSSRIRIIVNGIDTGSLLQSAGLSASPHESENAAFHVGLVGRLVPVKRVDLFLRTAGEILAREPGIDACFHIYGDGPLRASLEALSAELGIAGVVHFEGHCDDMPQRLARLNVLLMPSDHEGLPMTLLEAMTLKVPIVAHAVGGISALLQGGCGILVHDHGASAYADAVLSLNRNPDRRARIADHAHRRLLTRYSAERNATETVALYRAVLQQG